MTILLNALRLRTLIFVLTLLLSGKGEYKLDYNLGRIFGKSSHRGGKDRAETQSCFNRALTIERVFSKLLLGI